VHVQKPFGRQFLPTLKGWGFLVGGERGLYSNNDDVLNFIVFNCFGEACRKVHGLSREKDNMDQIHNSRRPARIIADAGSFGFADRWLSVARLFDAVITKTLTPSPIIGRPNAIYKVHGGWINSVGLANPGIDTYIDKIHKNNTIHKIISIHADTVLEYVEMVDKLNDLRCDGIELNLSCPNVHNSISSPEHIAQLLHAAQRASKHEIILKISPYQDYVGIMRVVGMTLQCVHVANTQPSLLYRRDGSVVAGGFSGKSIKYACYKATHDIRKMCADIRIISGGGVHSRSDVKGYLGVGADDVSVCSSVMWNPLRAWWLTRSRIEQRSSTH